MLLFHIVNNTHRQCSVQHTCGLSPFLQNCPIYWDKSFLTNFNIQYPRCWKVLCKTHSVNFCNLSMLCLIGCFQSKINCFFLSGKFDDLDNDLLLQVFYLPTEISDFRKCILWGIKCTKKNLSHKESSSPSKKFLFQSFSKDHMYVTEILYLFVKIFMQSYFPSKIQGLFCNSREVMSAILL